VVGGKLERLLPRILAGETDMGPSERRGMRQRTIAAITRLRPEAKEKAIAFPTDARLMHMARERLWRRRVISAVRTTSSPSPACKSACRSSPVESANLEFIPAALGFDRWDAGKRDCAPAPMRGTLADR